MPVPLKTETNGAKFGFCHVDFSKPSLITAIHKDGAILSTNLSEIIRNVAIPGFTDPPHWIFQSADAGHMKAVPAAEPEVGKFVFTEEEFNFIFPNLNGDDGDDDEAKQIERYQAITGGVRVIVIIGLADNKLKECLKKDIEALCKYANVGEEEKEKTLAAFERRYNLNNNGIKNDDGGDNNNDQKWLHFVSGIPTDRIARMNIHFLIQPIWSDLHGYLQNYLPYYPGLELKIFYCGHASSCGRLELSDCPVTASEFYEAMRPAVDSPDNRSSKNPIKIVFNCCYGMEMAAIIINRDVKYCKEAFDSYLKNNEDALNKEMKEYAVEAGITYHWVVACLTDLAGDSKMKIGDAFVYPIGEGQMRAGGAIRAILGKDGPDDYTDYISDIFRYLNEVAPSTWYKKKPALLNKRLPSVLPVLSVLPPKAATLVVFPAKYGDCTLLRWQDVNILIDGGPSTRKSMDGTGTLTGFTPCYWNYLTDEGIQKIDLVILTHGDYDHVEGLLPFVKQNLKETFSPIIKSTYTMTLKDFSKPCNCIKRAMAQTHDFVKMSKEKGIFLVPKTPEEEILKDLRKLFDVGTMIESERLIRKWNRGGDSLELYELWPTTEEKSKYTSCDCHKKSVISPNNCKKSKHTGVSSDCSKNINKLSLVICAVCKRKGMQDVKLLFTGDAEGKDIAKRLEECIPNAEERVFDYVDMPHHGSGEDQPDGTYLKSLKTASKILISTNGKTYGHPDDETVKAIAEFMNNADNKNCKLYFTYSEAVLHGNREKKGKTELSELFREKEIDPKARVCYNTNQSPPWVLGFEFEPKKV